MAACLFAALLPLGGCRSAYFGALNAGVGEPARRVEYAPQRHLDAYLPAARRATAPTVLFFYGGRWQSGERADYAFVGTQLAAAGIVALVADYRQFPEVRFPGFVEDAALALAWAREHAAELGSDADRLFLAGHSAGAHIAALLATDRRYLAAVDMRPCQLAGVIGIAGAYDFLPLTDRDLQQVFGAREQWPSSQPVNFVDGDEPPFLLLHGTGDRLVGLRNSTSLHARLQAVDGDVELRRYEGVGHIRILASLRYPRLSPALGDLLAFVDARSDAADHGCNAP